MHRGEGPGVYRILIVEDDAAVAAALRDMIQGHPRAAEFHPIETVDAARARDRLAGTGAATDAPAAGGPDRPDVAFVDIELDSLNGIDLVKSAFPDGSPTQVVYTTGHIEYCTAVYQTDHVSFLVKPIDQAELNAAIDRALAACDDQRADTLAVSVAGTTRLIPAHAIEFIESRKRKAHIHLVPNETPGTPPEVVVTYAKLSDLEERLPRTFLRSHKSFLVNMSHITELERGDLTVRSGARIPISQSRRHVVADRMASHLSLGD